MGRTRAYRREKRNEKIRRRKRLIRDLRKFYSDEHENGYIHGRKIQDALNGDRQGLFSKGYYGALPGSVKTKTKRAYASHRHKGGYGKAIRRSHHDGSQIMRMEIALKDYWSERGE